MSDRILTSDIGGTNARFAVFACDRGSGGLSLESRAELPTGAATSFGELLDCVLSERFGAKLTAFAGAVFAVAGPVRDDGMRARLPNVPWEVDLTVFRSRIGRQGNAIALRLINDFAAQVLATRTPAMRQAEVIQRGEVDANATIAAIGAGTGLGCSAMARGWDGRLVVVPSEAAHQEFPFLGAEERRFETFARDRLGDASAPPTYDGIVCGRGLSLLHQFFTGETKSPADIAPTLAEPSPVTQWFSRFYGRACRNYSLAVLPMGGLYICGGLAAKNPLLVKHPAFAQEFVASAVHAKLLQRVPVFLNANEQSGLWGAAQHAVQMLSDPLRSNP